MALNRGMNWLSDRSDLPFLPTILIQMIQVVKITQRSEQQQLNFCFSRSLSSKKITNWGSQLLVSFSIWKDIDWRTIIGLIQWHFGSNSLLLFCVWRHYKLPQNGRTRTLCSGRCPSPSLRSTNPSRPSQTWAMAGAGLITTAAWTRRFKETISENSEPCLR